ncbi:MULTISPECIES: hypothetical protein [Acinetobacter]|uniref:hypothetical protein n=1 Tax=Acinetobacter TaxID=469 RepID=UPI001C553BF6|nr:MULTISPECIES: hypothetical protein [Acinetobacter]
MSKESTAVQSCWTWVKRAFILPVRTINSVDIEPEYRDIFNLTLHQSQQRQVNYAMSNTFGFGGHIATSIFKKYAE